MKSLLGWLKGAPLDLAVFRITVMAVVLAASEVHRAPEFAQLPTALRTPPLGFAWAAALLPTDADSGRLLQLALLVCAALSLVGFFTRVATVLTAGLLLFVLALPQQWGAGVHTHHLWWFSVLLAASPCGDALSVDAWLTRRRLVAPSSTSFAYGVPVRAAWVSIGLIFFFPGMWKWQTQGLGWAWSDTLVNQLHFKWLEYGRVPRFRVDQYPLLLHVGGLGVLMLEMAVLPALLWRKTRLMAVTALLMFHAATQALFFISFSSLWACYTVFLPWSDWFPSTASAAPGQRSAWPAFAVAAVVLSGQLIFGAMLAEHAWPFACYPTFRFDPGPRAPVLVVEMVNDDGSRHELSREFLKGPEGQVEWSSMWSVLASPKERAIRSWWARHAPASVSREVRFYSGSLAIAPEGWAQPAVRNAVILSVGTAGAAGAGTLREPVPLADDLAGFSPHVGPANRRESAGKPVAVRPFFVAHALGNDPRDDEQCEENEASRQQHHQQNSECANHGQHDGRLPVHLTCRSPGRASPSRASTWSGAAGLHDAAPAPYPSQVFNRDETSPEVEDPR